MFSVLVIRLRSLRLLRVSGIVMRLRMFLLLITFLKASHSFRNRLLVICKNAYLFATMIMTSVSSPFRCCSGIVRLDNNTVGMGDAGIKSAIQGSNVPSPDEAVPSFVSGAMAKAGKGLLEGTLQAGTSAVSDKLLDLVGLGGKSAADKGKDTRDYLAAAFPELNAWERAGADASSAGMVDAGFENQKS